MQVAVGTFNLNNLFSRFNFRGELTALPEQPPIEFTSTCRTLLCELADHQESGYGRAERGRIGGYERCSICCIAEARRRPSEENAPAVELSGRISQLTSAEGLPIWVNLANVLYVESIKLVD